jgi:hypothetical protein
LQGFLGDFDLAGIEKKEGAEERGNRGTSDWKASWEDQDQGGCMVTMSGRAPACLCKFVVSN